MSEILIIADSKGNTHACTPWGYTACGRQFKYGWAQANTRKRTKDIWLAMEIVVCPLCRQSISDISASALESITDERKGGDGVK